MANIEYIQTCILFHIGTETYLVESENDTPNHIKLVREGCKKKKIADFSTKVGYFFFLLEKKYELKTLDCA